MHIYTLYAFLPSICQVALGRKRQIDGPGGFPEAGIGATLKIYGRCHLQLKRLSVVDASCEDQLGRFNDTQHPS